MPSVWLNSSTVSSSGMASRSQAAPCRYLAFKAGRRIESQQLAAVHEGHPVAVLGFIHVMGGDEDRRALSRQFVDQVPELAAGHRVHAAGRLVEEQQLRPVEDGAAERQALPPAAGQLMGGRVRPLLASPARCRISSIRCLSSSHRESHTPRHRTAGSPARSDRRTAQISVTCIRSAA